MARIFKTGLGVLSMALLAAHNAFACNVCYGAGVNSSTTAVALKISVLSLLVILLCVVGSIAWFFIQTTRRSKNICLTK